MRAFLSTDGDRVQEDMMTCTCDLGPGKFEGESALAALAYSSMLGGCSDTTTGDGEAGTLVDWFKAPLNFDADSENVAFARETGYCEACIAEALATECGGVSLFESSQGFVYLTVWTSTDEYEAALLEAMSEDEQGEADRG